MGTEFHFLQDEKSSGYGWGVMTCGYVLNTTERWLILCDVYFVTIINNFLKKS